MDADKRAHRIDDDQVRLVVEVFRMLADHTRIGLLWTLVDGELSVNELADRIDKPAPSVSQHLAKLRMARLVKTRRAGTTIFYSLENEHVQLLVIAAVYNAEHAGPGVPIPPPRRRRRPGAGRRPGPNRTGWAAMTSDSTHQHHYDHEHGHDHDHDFRKGISGGLMQIFAPHSHDAADSVDTALETSAVGIRAVKISLIGLGATTAV